MNHKMWCTQLDEDGWATMECPYCGYSFKWNIYKLQPRIRLTTASDPNAFHIGSTCTIKGVLDFGVENADVNYGYS